MPRLVLRALAVAAAAALGPGCTSEYENPFQRSTQAPPPGADIIFTSNVWSARPGAGRDLFAVEEDGTAPTRLTYCNAEQRRCDTLEAAPAPDRQRVVARRLLDTDSDGRITAADGEALVFIDLTRAAEATLVNADARVSGIDWSADGQVLVFSSAGEGGREDLWRVDPNGQNARNLTSTADVRERRPRVDPTTTVAVYERIDSSGKGRIFIFQNSSQQVPVTEGGPGTDPLAGTPYVVGSDADPDYSPDGRRIVFRRLSGLGDGSLGSWEILTVAIDGTGLMTLATGPAFRGAPDWGPRGIVFSEVDAAAGSARLVVVQPDGTGSRTVVTVGSAFELGHPRWLP